MSNSVPLQTNMSAIGVAGVGGLGMVAMVVVMAAAFEPARWLLGAGIGGGASVAIALIVRRRHRNMGGPRQICLSFCFVGLPLPEKAHVSSTVQPWSVEDH